jgi:hypothetical protein
MNCYFCNSEAIKTEATATCVVCLYHACSRPSGRTDGHFHGEPCRAPGCNSFVCEYDVHQHVGPAVVGPASIPTCFPYLTVGISFDGLSAGEISLGHRKAVPLVQSANRKLTRAMNFLTGKGSSDDATLWDPIVAEYLEADRVKPRIPSEMTPEYFDAGTVASLCRFAAAALSAAWSGLSGKDLPVFTRASAAQPAGTQYSGLVPAAVEKRLVEFVAKGGGDDPAQWTADHFKVLSPRLAQFLREVKAVAPADSLHAFAFTPRIRQTTPNFDPTPTLLNMKTQLDGWTMT